MRALSLTYFFLLLLSALLVKFRHVDSCFLLGVFVCVCVCVISIKYLFCVCVDFSYLIKVVVHLLVAMIIIFSRSCVYVERKQNLYIYNIRNLVSGIEKQIKSVCVRVVSFFVLFFYFFLFPTRVCGWLLNKRAEIENVRLPLSR